MRKIIGGDQGISKSNYRRISAHDTFEYTKSTEIGCSVQSSSLFLCRFQALVAAFVPNISQLLPLFFVSLRLEIIRKVLVGD